VILAEIIINGMVDFSLNGMENINLKAEQKKKHQRVN